MPPNPSRKSAEILGLQALGWLAGVPGALERLLGASGMDAAGLKSAAGEPHVLGAVLEFLLANEDLLLDFCSHQALKPAQIHAARHVLEA